MQKELTIKEWVTVRDMAAGLPCAARGRTITSLIKRGYILKTRHGWYWLTDLGRNVGTYGTEKGR